MFNLDEVIESFRQSEIEFDCPKMTLIQRKKGGEFYEGQGYIRQDKNGNLTFKIYVTRHANANIFSIFDMIGKVDDDLLYYHLTATDTDDTTWVADHVMPKPNWNMLKDTVIFAGTLRSMSTKKDWTQERNILRLYYFENFELPLNACTKYEKNNSPIAELDRATFTTLGIEFEIKNRHGTGLAIIEAINNSNFPVGFHMRLQEALQFITARSARWSSRVESVKDSLEIELSSPESTSQKTTMSAPFMSFMPEFRSHGWILFGKYLEYVIANTNTYWNPVAYHLYNAREASANSIDARAIGVSVAVEAVASLIDLPPDPLTANRLKEFKSNMLEALHGQTAHREFSNRLKGAIDGLDKKSTIETLRLLGKMGRLGHEYEKSWSYLRNRHVHPKISALKKPDDKTYASQLHHIQRVEMILYQLIFHLIGYEGEFTDCSGAAIQTMKYPLI